ncbi:MAG: hypothetical protein KDE58_41930, partial [Caldilineaceae bacterium]|nr:hypothetical protein [Caldilineaceae bacterium]
HARPYVPTTATRLVTNWRTLKQRATKLDETYALREQMTTKTRGVRQQAHAAWDKRYRQLHDHYRDYIASGAFQLWLLQQRQRLQQQWQRLQPKLQQLLNAARKRLLK